MIILGLGSNVGNRINYLHSAIDLLSRETLSDIVVSPYYESPALLPENAPADWNQPFINAVIMGNSTLPCQALLTAIKHIEQTLGRKPRGIWGPREIDIDILAYHDHVTQEEHLIIPHPDLHLRDFVLFPFADIYPHWTHPVLQKTIATLKQELETSRPSSCYQLQPIYPHG